MTWEVMAWAGISAFFLLLAGCVRYIHSGGRVLITDPFFITTLFFLLYYVAGQFGRITLDAFDAGIYATVARMVAFSSFALLLAALAVPVSFKVKLPRFEPLAGSSLLLGGCVSLAVGYHFWSANYGRIGGLIHAFSSSYNRVDRNEMLTSMGGNVPYTHFMYVAQCFILAGLLVKGWKLRNALLLSTLSVSPLLLFFLLEGERTSLVRHFVGPLFIAGFLEYRGVIVAKVKWVVFALIIYIALALLGNFRTAVQIYLGTGRTDLFHSQISRHGAMLLIPAEFYAVNYTTNKLVHNVTSGKQGERLGATYLQGAGYLFPRSVYRFFGAKKAATISDQLGIDVAEEIGRERKLGFGMSGIAEAYVNFSIVGPPLFAVFLVLAISVWRRLVYSTGSGFLLVYLLLISPIFVLVHRIAFASSFAYVVHLLFISGTMYAAGFLMAKVARRR